jgi:hypothetical protein
MRSGASVCHDRAVSAEPRGARTVLAPSMHATSPATGRG